MKGMMASRTSATVYPVDWLAAACVWTAAATLAGSLWLGGITLLATIAMAQSTTMRYRRRENHFASEERTKRTNQLLPPPSVVARSVALVIGNMNCARSRYADSNRARSSSDGHAA